VEGPATRVAYPPPQVGHDGSMIGREDPVDSVADDLRCLDDDVLAFAAGAEEDVVDALVDEFGPGFQRRRGVGGGQGDRVGRGVARGPRVGGDIT
jgi:hypothetical protein